MINNAVWWQMMVNDGTPSGVKLCWLENPRTKWMLLLLRNASTTRWASSKPPARLPEGCPKVGHSLRDITIRNQKNDTLWLCQNSYWHWPLVMDLPMENGDFSIFFILTLNYQRLSKVGRCWEMMGKSWKTSVLRSHKMMVSLYTNPEIHRLPSGKLR